MENWIQEISKTYISSFSPKRKDLVENYVSLNEEQKLELFSQNVHSYLHEQFKNAFGFDMNELSEEDKKSFLSVLFEFKGAREVQARTGEATGDYHAATGAYATRAKRLETAKRLAASLPVSGSRADEIRKRRTGYRLDAAEYGDNFLRHYDNPAPAKKDFADASASLAGRSEELAKQMSGELKALQAKEEPQSAKEEPQSAKEEPHWVATVSGTRIKVPIGHVVGTVKGGGTVMGPESHVVAAAPGRIKKIHRQPRPKK